MFKYLASSLLRVNLIIVGKQRPFPVRGTLCLAAVCRLVIRLAPRIPTDFAMVTSSGNVRRSWVQIFTAHPLFQLIHVGQLSFEGDAQYLYLSPPSWQNSPGQF